MCQYLLPTSEELLACMQLSILCSNGSLVSEYDSCRFSICKLRWSFWKLTQQAGTTQTAGLALPGNLSPTESQAMSTAYRQTMPACSCRQELIALHLYVACSQEFIYKHVVCTDEGQQVE